MHGRISSITHYEQGVLSGLPNPFDACRYHSLVVDESTLPDMLLGTAWTGDGTLMALQHRELPVYGVQFHPEAILTDSGYRILANFLQLAGLPIDVPIVTEFRERDEPARATRAFPLAPVTF
jgi:anthranilate/para-aminobenzoate synthase component II